MVDVPIWETTDACLSLRTTYTHEGAVTCEGQYAFSAGAWARQRGSVEHVLLGRGGGDAEQARQCSAMRGC
jgi:hypothetical protein